MFIILKFFSPTFLLKTKYVPISFSATVKWYIFKIFPILGYYDRLRVFFRFWNQKIEYNVNCMLHLNLGFIHIVILHWIVKYYKYYILYVECILVLYKSFTLSLIKLNNLSLLLILTHPPKMYSYRQAKSFHPQSII